MIETKTAVEASPSTPTTTTTATPKGKSRGTSLGLVVAHSVCLLIHTIIIKSFFDFENASKALAFYGVYHRYGWNQVVHFFGVPGIIWSLLIFMVHVPLPFLGSAAADASLNHAQFIAICYNLFYLSIDPLGAVLYAPVVYAMYASAMTIRRKDHDTAQTAASSHGKMVPWYGTGKALQWALVVHVVCWYVQIHLGHKLIEGAQPAVLQSLGGALSVAPLFAFYEGLWVLGINKGLQESTQRLVDEYTREICTEQGMDAMKACASLILTD